MCFEQSLTAYLTVVFCDKMRILGNNTCDDYSLFEELLYNKPNQFNMLNVFYRYKNSSIIPAENLIVKKNVEVIEKVMRYGTKQEDLSNYLYMHYKNNYDTIPIWVVLHQLTFGELQTLFNLLKLIDRKDFVDKIYNDRKNNRTVSAFSNKINYIRLLRNIINHYEPIIPFILNKACTKDQRKLIKIINLLKINYYSSILHDNAKINKPTLSLRINRYNVNNLSFLIEVIRNI